MNARQIEALGLDDAQQVTVRAGEGEATLPLLVDPRVPDGCVWVPGGYPQTFALAPHGATSVIKAAGA
jgi:NADH-quinone oxidoreductase subunit G